MRGAYAGVARPCRKVYNGDDGRPTMDETYSDAFDELRSAGGILITAAPDEYLSGDFQGETPLSQAWSDAVDAMMFAYSETEKLLKLLAEKAGLPPPESNLSESDEQLVIPESNVS